MERGFPPHKGFTYKVNKQDSKQQLIFHKPIYMDVLEKKIWNFLLCIYEDVVNFWKVISQTQSSWIPLHFQEIDFGHLLFMKHLLFSFTEKKQTNILMLCSGKQYSIKVSNASNNFAINSTSTSKDNIFPNKRNGEGYLVLRFAFPGR